ncbi:MAG: lytic murein transglycosylase [Methylophilaceae bacterium]
MFKVYLVIVVFLCLSPAFADERPPLSIWLKDLKQEALQQDISPKTIAKTFKNAKFLPRVIALDRAQPEFISPFLTYLDSRVTANNVALGREKLQENDALLTRVEAQYGVPKQVLVAFWGMETHYGNNQGDFGLPSALMTLAYEGRRADFFRAQLFDAMRAVDAGYSTVAGLRGSWAGAMGHMQFMPSTLMQHGVDADGDGHISITKSLPDAFASAANYLSSIGWRKDEPVALEVKLPDNFDYSQAQLLNRKNSADWRELGVLLVDGKPLPDIENTAIVLPQGWHGPVFLVASNFDVVMDWNRSVNYALSVSHLATQLSADQPILGGADTEKAGMTFEQMWSLQEKLNELGFDCGAPDGFPGVKTQAAIRQYQAKQNLPQDGYAGPALYQRLFLP